MKIILITAVMILSVSLNSFASEQELQNEEFLVMIAGGDISKIPLREDPGPQSEVILQTIHTKELSVLAKDISFKWTGLGYGAMTHKVIVPELAGHTVFNHRNPGEDGPCLRSDRRMFAGVGIPVLPNRDGSMPILDPHQSQEIVISVKIQNQYSINRDKGICKVQMVEDVRTSIDGEVFYHVYKKDMGFRYIEDCPLAT